jgi:membrane-associated protease RseP (regulator of RpoE activity)
MPAFPAPHVSYRTNFPKSLSQSKAVYVAGLATNSPAYIAGLRTNDYVAEWNTRKVTSLHQFRWLLNNAPADATINVKALRNDQPLDLTIHAGTEKFYNHGWFALTLPSFVEGWDLWPDPGFSLVFFGYEPKQKIRRDLNAEKELTFEKWHTWCAIFEVSASDQIVGQNYDR